MSWRRTLDPILRKVGLYSSYTLRESEFVGTIPKSGRQILKRAGYEPVPEFGGIKLAAAKQHPQTGETHDFSRRKVDPSDYTRQFHVHGWLRGETIDLFSHAELRPDIRFLPAETPRETIVRLRSHYHPEGDEYVRGATCDELAGVLQ